LNDSNGFNVFNGFYDSCDFDDSYAYLILLPKIQASPYCPKQDSAFIL
jgi:hypothetical protein